MFLGVEPHCRGHLLVDFSFICFAKCTSSQTSVCGLFFISISFILYFTQKYDDLTLYRFCIKLYQE